MAYYAGSVGERLSDHAPLSPLIVVAVASLVARAGLAVLGFLLGSELSIEVGFSLGAFPSAALNVLLAIPLYALLRRGLRTRARRRRSRTCPYPCRQRARRCSCHPRLSLANSGRRRRSSRCGLRCSARSGCSCSRCWCSACGRCRCSRRTPTGHVRRPSRSSRCRFPAARGDIVDLGGAPLVSNRPSLELQLDPSLVSSSMARHRIVLRLAKLIGADPRAVWEDVDRQIRLDPLAPVTVARDVDRSVVLYLGEHAARYTGVTVVEGEKRTYPFGRLASHIFGQLSEIDAKELKLPAYQGYKAGWVIGQNGVEGTYDNWLRGQDGTKRVTIDATGTPLSDQVVRAARSGYRLRLTIDKTVQHDAELALAGGVKRNKGNGADSGVLIAMDAHTGALRAIASYPNFDPNWFVSPNLKANRGHLRYLETSKTTPQLNRAITGLYPAASTFKPFTAIAAVQSGVLPNIYDTIQCSGKVKIAGHVFNNWDPYADMQMSLPTALSQSCDTYFYELG